MAGRVTQETVEVAVDPDAVAHVTQLSVSTSLDVEPKAKATQISVAVATAGSPPGVGATPPSRLRMTQFVVAVAVPFWAVPMPAVFPTLKGLTYSVTKRPVFSTNVNSHVSGAEVRIGYFSWPLWEFKLSYDYLPDTAGEADLKTMMGFFGSNYGALMAFLFKDPSDYTVDGQYIGTGDGSTTNFLIQRTYGAGGHTFTEPVGWVDLGADFNVYIDGILQTSGYTVAQTQMTANELRFGTPPAAGEVVTVDMNYYFAVRFKDDMLDFEEFMHQLWELKELNLRSLRRQ